MLGRDLTAVFSGHDVTGLDRSALDITDAAAVMAAVDGHDLVINTAAYTRVDDAESDEPTATAVNGTAVGHLALACSRTGARLVQVSTDYVFDGTATTPYGEQESRHPVSAYGRSKAEGERLALELHEDGTFIVRTAWLYGEHGPNFARTMLTLARDRETVSVVDDQVGQPTWTRDLARQILALVESGASPGVYHGTSSGRASWFDFARAIFAGAGLDPDRVTRSSSAQFVRPARRPSFSVLGHDAWSRAGLEPLRPWRDALTQALTEKAVTAP